MTRRTKPAPEPPCDPESAAVGNTVTATVYPIRTRYNKPVLVTGTVRGVCDRYLTLICGDGYHTIRKQDILRIKKVEGTA